jgi:hypothetical protein
VFIGVLLRYGETDTTLGRASGEEYGGDGDKSGAKSKIVI